MTIGGAGRGGLLAFLLAVGCGDGGTAAGPPTQPAAGHGGTGAGGEAGAGASGGATGGAGGSGTAAGGAGAGGSGAPLSPMIADCGGLLSDTSEQPATALAMPGYLESVTDPAFGTKITRVTGDVGDAIPGLDGAAGNWRDVGGAVYAKIPAWNADQSLLQMTNTSTVGVLLLDGEDYHVRAYPSGIPSAPGSEKRWHPTDPERMVYVAVDGRAGYWSPLTGAVDERFVPSSSQSDCRMGPWEGNVSLDGNWVVISCDVGGADPTFFAVDLRDGTKHVTIAASDLGFDGLDWASISPRGDYIVASQNWQEQRALSFGLSSWAVVASWQYMGHFDLGLDPDGNQVAANGSGYLVSLADGMATQVLDTGTDNYHTSTRNLQVPGWSFNTPYGPADLLANEVWAMELKEGGRFRRLGHHRSTGGGDRSPVGAASPDGTRVFYRSDWGNGSGPVYGFVVDIRELCTG